MEEFYTVQGEGFYTGHAAYFIRLAGCDVGCHWCDVKESWPVEGFPVKTAEELAMNASNFPGKMVVITGGEPAMYDLNELCNSLKEKGFRVHIETSGAYPLQGKFDWICVSPKKFKSPLKEVLIQAHELKVIVFNSSDFAWAVNHENKISEGCKKYLQPEWGKRDQVKAELVDFVKNHPEWQYSVQTHKYMDIP